MNRQPHGTLASVAREADISTVFLWQVSAGTRHMSHEVAVRVSKATGMPLSDLPYTRIIRNEGAL